MRIVPTDDIKVGLDVKDGNRLPNVLLDVAAKLIWVAQVVFAINAPILRSIGLSVKAPVIPVFADFVRVPFLFRTFDVLRNGVHSQSGFADVEDDLTGTTKVHLSNEAECAALGDVDNRLGKVPKTGEHLLF